MKKSFIFFLALGISLHASGEYDLMKNYEGYKNSPETVSQKETLFNELSSFVREVLPDLYRRNICRNATKTDYAQFVRVVNFIKTKVNNPDFSELSPGEISYFVECDEGTNAINFNFTPKVC